MYTVNSHLKVVMASTHTYNIRSMFIQCGNGWYDVESMVMFLLGLYVVDEVIDNEYFVNHLFQVHVTMTHVKMVVPVLKRYI